MNTESPFDSMADQWDANPTRRALATAVAGAFERHLKNTPCRHALEFGCGSGMVGLQLAEQCQSMVMLDPSAGMIEQLKHNIAKTGFQHLYPIQANLNDPALKGKQFDLIFSAMVMHHLHDIPSTLQQLTRMLEHQGLLMTADLVTEDGRFHDSEMTIPHHGFDPEALAQIHRQFGLQIVEQRIIHVIKKSTGRYPVFCMVARKLNQPHESD